MARVLRLTREALHPKAVHDLKQLISKVVEWEDELVRMAAKHKETLLVIWKMAALMERCLPDVQDVENQKVDGVSENYDKLKQRILAWAANKFANSVRPVPTDVGWVHNQEQDERVEQEDVGAVTMNTVCHGCGGCGHLKWECPTLQRNEKANRKGGYEKGKGKGVTDVRGGDKGKGKGEKGAGKGGFKGTCYKCGKQGHRAADCRTRVNMVDEYEDEDECEMQPVGGGRLVKLRFRRIGVLAGRQPVRSHRDRRRGRDTSDGGRARRQGERECDRVQRCGSEEAFGISREDGYGWKSCCAGFGRLLHRKSEDRTKDEVEGEGWNLRFRCSVRRW